jgi:hypothetical protein
MWKISAPVQTALLQSYYGLLSAALHGCSDVICTELRIKFVLMVHSISTQIKRYIIVNS